VNSSTVSADEVADAVRKRRPIARRAGRRESAGPVVPGRRAPELTVRPIIGQKRARSGYPLLAGATPVGAALWLLSPRVLPDPGPQELKLTGAQRQVAQMAASGMSTAAIAAQRCCSGRTVANQLAAVYQKLGIHGRRELRARLRQPETRGAVHLRSEICAGLWSLIGWIELRPRRYFLARYNGARRAQARALSPREREVWAATTVGQSNKLIAFSLGLSVPTVATHLKRARWKLGAWARHWFWLK
jgi:DNA-binding CsgD family transcriptional regulator